MVPRDFLSISAMAYLARFSRGTTRFSRHFNHGLFGEIFSWYHKIFSPFQQWLIWRDLLMVPWASEFILNYKFLERKNISNHLKKEIHKTIASHLYWSILI